ncbi:MAG: hypothetical protein QW707_09170 [Candidatus Bathyarchaeia archaeon]
MGKKEQFIKCMSEIMREQRERRIREALEFIERYRDLPQKLEKERRKKRRKPLSEKARGKLLLLEFRVSMLNLAKRIIEDPDFDGTLTPDVEGTNFRSDGEKG